MKERVFEIVSNIMGWPLKEIDEDSSPDNIPTWDSLNHINLMLALEEEFDLHFTDEQIMEMVNLRLILKIFNIIAA